MVVGACIPATQKTEAGESLEPGWWRLQSVEIAPLHWATRVRLHLKKKSKGGLIPQEVIINLSVVYLKTRASKYMKHF